MRIAVATPVAALPQFMTNVSDEEMDTIRGLLATWQQKFTRNQLRSMYFDGKAPLRPTGNIPEESFKKITAVLDWPEKAVTAPAERSVFEGFVTPSGVDDPFDLLGLLDENRFDLELPQAITSAYKHSCSFITTALGDERSGEPAVQIMARSAEWSAAEWDSRKRAISGMLAITDVDRDSNQPVAMDVYLPHVVLQCERRPSGSWVAQRLDNPLGEVLAEPLMYDPQLDRPFGRSRISRAVMNATDHALTTIIRAEVGADFYIIPKVILTKLAEDAFTRGKYEMAVDRWVGITKDEDGDSAEVHQLQQMTMQPLMEQYKMHATRFSGATGVPISNLGIVTDNPPSAEALYADDRRLVMTARRQNRILASSLRRVAQKVVRLRDGGDVTPELRALDVTWADPAFVSPGSAADALVKLAPVFPWLGESEVSLEYAGFSGSDITRLQADKRRAEGGSLLRRVLDGDTGGPGVTGDDEA